MTEPNEDADAGGTVGRLRIPKIRRPMLMAGAVAALVLVLSIWSIMHRNKRAIASDEQVKETRPPRLYVPDRDGAQRLREKTREASTGDTSRVQGAEVREGTVAKGNLPAARRPQGDARERSAPPAAELTVQAKYAERRRELLLERELHGLESELKMELEAKTATSAMKSAQEYRDRTLREATTLLGAAAAGEGGGTGMEGGAELSQLLGPAMAAMRASASSGAGAGAMGGASGFGQLGSALRALGGEGEAERDPNKFADKLDFFKNGGQHLAPGELPYHMQDPKTPYELQMGSRIPCIMMRRVISSVPGMITARVTMDVLDSVHHEHVLIPQDTIAVGTYNAQVTASNQARLQIVWTRLNFPNGQKLNLGSMSGSDAVGVAGIEDKIDRHIGARLGAAVMASLFTVGVEVTAPQNGDRFGSAVHRGVGENVLNFSTELARELGSRPPTLTIRQGAECGIDVNLDVAFQRPYDEASHAPVRARAQ